MYGGAPGQLYFGQYAALTAVNLSGTAALTLPSLTSGGTATQTITATAAVALPSLSAAGAAEHSQTATGAAILPSLVTSGTGTGSDSPSATAALTLGSLVTSGAAEQTQTATGAATLPSLATSGVADMFPSGTSAATLPSLTASGSATATVPPFYPNANGSLNEWATTVGPEKWAALAETPYDDDTTYVGYTGGVGVKEERFTLRNTADAGASVTSFLVNVRVKLMTAGFPTFRYGVRLSGAETVEAQILGSAGSYVDYVFAPARPGGGDWTVSDLDSVELIFRVDAGEDIRVTTIYGDVTAVLPTGTGAATLPSLAAAGSSEQTITSTAALILPSLVAAASALHSQEATAALVLPSLATSGVATQTITGTAALTLPSLATAGVGDFAAPAPYGRTEIRNTFARTAIGLLANDRDLKGSLPPTRVRELRDTELKPTHPARRGRLGL